MFFILTWAEHDRDQEGGLLIMHYLPCTTQVGMVGGLYGDCPRLNF